jgi:predicted  nucleic acid-binding Zn-ribbon protein
LDIRLINSVELRNWLNFNYEQIYIYKNYQLNTDLSELLARPSYIINLNDFVLRMDNTTVYLTEL